MPILKNSIDEDFVLSSSLPQEGAMSYNVISFQERLKLIEMIVIERATFPKACKELKIKQSTAKYILSCYRHKGTVMKKHQIDHIKEEDMKQRILDLKRRQEESKEALNIRKSKKLIHHASKDFINMKKHQVQKGQASN